MIYIYIYIYIYLHTLYKVCINDITSMFRLIYTFVRKPIASICHYFSWIIVNGGSPNDPSPGRVRIETGDDWGSPMT